MNKYQKHTIVATLIILVVAFGMNVETAMNLIEQVINWIGELQ